MASKKEIEKIIKHLDKATAKLWEVDKELADAVQAIIDTLDEQFFDQITGEFINDA